MNETVLINAKKALGPKAIQQFKSDLTDDTIVTMYIEETSSIFERPLRDLRKFFEDEEVEKAVPNDDCVISFMTDNKVLQIIGLDFNWWIAVVRNKKYRRLERLFDEQKIEETQDKPVKSKKKEEVVQTYKCACGLRKDGRIESIEKFEGTKKEMVVFVNKLFQKTQIRTMFKGVTVFCVNYKFDDDLNDINNWFTLEELSEKGVFVK